MDEFLLSLFNVIFKYNTLYQKSNVFLLSIHRQKFIIQNLYYFETNQKGYYQ